MLNFYFIILIAAIVSGIGVSAWGWRIMQQAKKRENWPTVKGTITKSDPSTEHDELLPHIEFSYDVAGQSHNKVFQFPEGTNPLPEFSQSYVKKYPVGKSVVVYYDPENVEEATLEPSTQGDWMILALGLIMSFCGVVAFFIE